MGTDIFSEWQEPRKPLIDTLEQARQMLLANLDDGLTCPCCGQHAKRYRRKFNSGMALSLIRIYRLHKLDWCQITVEIPARSRSEGKIKYWGMLEESPVPRDNGVRSGWWRINEKGEQFLLHGLRVPKKAIVYNAICYGFDTREMVNIEDCLGDKFNLWELLGQR